MSGTHRPAHGHEHASSQGHSHGPAQACGGHAPRESRLRWALAVLVVFLVVEVTGALFSGSLALMADAGHMVTDIAALAISLFATWLVRRPATARHTFGYRRAEVLAALLNGASLLALSGVLFYKAAQRLGDPHPIDGPIMIAVALAGLAANIVVLGLLHRDKDDNLNIRGAWLHVMADTLGSLAAVVSGLLVWRMGWLWVDSVATFAIGALVVVSSMRLLFETTMVLMESAPVGLNVEAVRLAMTQTDGVLAVHDLHVWTITSELVALSGHVVAAPEHDSRTLLAGLREMLATRFGIQHITIQIEPPGFDEGPVCA